MKEWVANLSTTNFRIFVSLMLAVVLVIVLLAGIMLRIELQTEIVWGLLTFVGAMLGIDVTQFSIKRKTEIVTPPQVTAEHATVTTVAAVPVPVPPVGPPNRVVREGEQLRMPESVTALKAGVLARTADPATPAGALVDGEGD